MDCFNLVLTLGSKKVPVRLDWRFQGTSHDLGHLSDVVQAETGIEPACQKLIYKGRTLFKPDDIGSDFMKTSLASLGIKDGERVMVLGRKKIPEKQSANKKHQTSNGSSSQGKDSDPLGVLTSEVDQLCARLEDKINSTPQTQDILSLKSSKKCMMSIHEESMKLLERVDSTPVKDDNSRTRRKGLVNKLQSNLDKLEEQVDKIKSQIKLQENPS